MNNSIQKDTIIKLLSGMSSEKEIRKYLDKFSSDDFRFAVIKVGGAVIQNDLDNLVTSLAFLNEVGLRPIIVHGGGKRINNKLNELNIETSFINGLRVTDKNTINIVEDVLIEFNKEIVDALKKQSCETKKITSRESNIITVRPENDKLGFVGTPTNIDTNILKKITKANEVPIIAPLGLDLSLIHI